MLQYLQNNIVLLIVIIAFGVIVIAGVALYIYKKSGLAGLREEAYKLFLAAERIYTESGSGKQKFDYVVGMLYNMLPAVLRFIVTQEELEALIQKWFDEIKDLLDDGKLNDSTKEA